MDFAAIFGIIGAVFSITHLLPELALALKVRHMNDVSWGMLIISEFNFISWLMYGILEPAYPIVAAAGVNTVVTTILIVLKRHYQYGDIKPAYQLARSTRKQAQHRKR